MKTAYAQAGELRGIIQHARALVFDFDGTLVDSNEIKWRGFQATFNEFPERLSEIMSYCQQHHHASRGEKFQYVYEQILHVQYTSETASELHRRFEEATTRQIIEAAEIPGAGQFLTALVGRQRIALLSSTPHNILVRILEARGWRQLFDDVRGAPVDKARWLTAFAFDRRVSAAEIVFFGDTLEDANAAERAGCVFVTVGRGAAGRVGIRSIADFRQL